MIRKTLMQVFGLDIELLPMNKLVKYSRLINEW